MEKNYFTSLTSNSKTELIWNYGEIIVTVDCKNTYITLFLLDQFFVELYVDKESNALTDVVIQEDQDVLYEYIKEVDISDLLN